MAEVFPENVSDNQDDEDLHKEENPISVLLLATKWQFDTYGLSTVNKSLVNNLRVVDPEGMKIKITCAVVEEEGHIREDERKEAEKYKVKLKGTTQSRGRKKRPTVEWVDEFTSTYYLDFVRQHTFNFIIGHAPYLANAALNLRDIYAATGNKPKVILMIHDHPRTTDRDIDEDSFLEWLSEADFVFSVGKEVKAEIFASLSPEKRSRHKLYIPGFPLELFNVRRSVQEGNKVQGTQHVTLMTGDRKDSEINGLDFPLALTSSAAASKHILDFDRVKTNFVLIINNKEDKEQWKKEFITLIQKEEFKGRSLQFQSDAPETLEKLKTHMRKSNLFILPLKPDSPLFGAEALSAVAAGVPILVSDHSGIASVLKILMQDESVVQEPDDVTWKDRILQKLLRPEESQKTATRLREQLLLDTSIAQTHLEFTRIIAGKIPFIYHYLLDIQKISIAVPAVIAYSADQ